MASRELGWLGIGDLGSNCGPCLRVFSPFDLRSLGRGCRSLIEAQAKQKLIEMGVFASLPNSNYTPFCSAVLRRVCILPYLVAR